MAVEAVLGLGADGVGVGDPLFRQTVIRLSLSCHDIAILIRV